MPIKRPTARVAKGRLAHKSDRRGKNGEARILGRTPTVILGRGANGWAYEMKLLKRDRRWIVTELRVFADSAEIEARWISDVRDRAQDAGDSERVLMYERALRAIARDPSASERTKKIPSSGLTARDLRHIPFGKNSALARLNQVSELARKLFANRRRQLKLQNWELGAVKRVNAQLRKLVRLARIARCYVDAWKLGERRLNAYVAGQFQIEISQARDAIHQARREDLLSTAHKQGVAGGELTPRALDLLIVGDSQLNRQMIVGRDEGLDRLIRRFLE